ncbi:IS66 family transposase [Ferrimonas pelagia]|uniref:IS66 family transposase n=1 Tax=Ferrimonas pelagia TaxID=1177826 RepID=A0ABP9EDR9_9GAMM
MPLDIHDLPDDPELLKQMLAQQGRAFDELKANYHSLLEQFRLAQQRQFGKSSEAHPGQGELFDEADAEDTTDAQSEPEVEAISYTRSKPKRKPLPAELPREQVVLDLADEDKFCDCCASELHQIGQDTSEKLEFIPAQLKVIETIRPKYACRHCEQHNESVEVKQAPPAKSVIPKGIATPSLLSQIVTSKYQYGLPLYRQEAMFKQYGIDLSRKTMSDWMMRSADALRPLYERLRQELLNEPILQADETTLQVVKKDKSTCYMWLYCSGADSPTEHGPLNIVLYDYQNSRAGQCPVKFLDGFSSYLQVDGYAGYEQTAATLVGCWAHARRKFIEAKKVQPKGKTGKADMAINHIQKLYAIEASIKDQTPDFKRAARQERAKPQLQVFRQWLEKSAVHAPPKSALGKAISYCLNQWHKLERYVDDGELNIDNNRAERAIKPFVIGRKNWLFSNTSNGAQGSATLYSIVETAKANGLVPYDYLTHLFDRLPHFEPDADLTELLPWNVQIP